MLASEQLLMESIPQSEMKRNMNVSFLKRHKKAVPDGLSLSFFKNGEVLTLEVTKSPGAKCGREETVPVTIKAEVRVKVFGPGVHSLE